MEAGGYEDEWWWDTEDARAWRRGELTNEAAKYACRVWLKRFLEDPDLFDRMMEEERFAHDEVQERWREWRLLDLVEFEAALDARWQPKRATEPAFWRDEHLNGASQPVVGVCWYEARAYASWQSAQTGMAFRLPTEVEWEAAARGVAGRSFAYGDAFDATIGNTVETHLRRTTPVGVFVEGDTPEGVSDMAGNVAEWTSSAWGGEDDEIPGHGYPYDPGDGREDPNAPPSCPRVARGGAWARDESIARAAYRYCGHPTGTVSQVGFRCCVGPPTPTR